MRRNARHGARKWGEEECCPSTPVVPRVQHGPETELSRFHVFIGARGSRGVQHHHHTARETGTKSTKIRKPLYLSYLSRLKINSVNTRGEQQAQLRCSQPHRLWLGSESCRGGPGCALSAPPAPSVLPFLSTAAPSASLLHFDPESAAPTQRSPLRAPSSVSAALPHTALRGLRCIPSPPPPPPQYIPLGTTKVPPPRPTTSGSPV